MSGHGLNRRPSGGERVNERAGVLYVCATFAARGSWAEPLAWLGVS